RGRSRSGVRAHGASRRARRRARGAPRGPEVRFRRARARGAKLPPARGGDRRSGQHAPLAKALRRAAPAPPAPGHLRRLQRKARGNAMRRHRIAKLFFFVLPLFLIFLALMVWAVFGLWNWLMPSIFGLRAITYWQALGLMALSWILFRGFRGPRMHRGFGRG